MEKKVKIGVLGCANIAKRFMIKAILDTGKFELIGIASRNLEKAEKFTDIFGSKAYGNYSDLIMDPDIEAIYMPLPTGLHYEWLLKCIEQGKHIFCEKSLVSSIEEAKEVIDKAKKNNIVIMENFMFRFHSQHEEIKSILTSGKIGELRSIRTSFGFPPFRDKDNIRYQRELGGGALLDAGGYTIQASRMFLNENIEVVGSTLHMDNNLDVDIWGSAYFRDDTGLTSHLNFGFDNYYQCNYELWGSKGKLVCHRSFTAGPGFRPTITIEVQDHAEKVTLSADNHFVNILHAFYEQITSQYNSDLLDDLYTQADLIHKIKSHARINK